MNVNGGIDHIPVMLGEVLEVLSPQRGERILDCTVGAGGHARALLERAVPGGVLVGIDLDPRALERAETTLRGVKGGRYYLFQGPYSNLDQYLLKVGIEAVDVILFDLGVSSLQLDDPSRGFSFRYDAYLDMRMDDSRGFTAAELLNSLSREELERIFRVYGEERFASRIARAIVERRLRYPVETTADLANIVLSALPSRAKRQRIHPATRVFQALRIVVNDELHQLETGLSKAVKALAPGGRLGVISFHSLEDRIVKHAFRQLAKGGGFELLTKKPLRPSPDEVAGNARARSAKFRAIRKAG